LRSSHARYPPHRVLPRLHAHGISMRLAGWRTWLRGRLAASALSPPCCFGRTCRQFSLRNIIVTGLRNRIRRLALKALPESITRPIINAGATRYRRDS
jgi:hypothetical protein